MNTATAPGLPQTLADNPRLDRWVRFTAPGEVAVATGKVEIGQGVLTAMRQIAAEELDVAPERIRLHSGDTELTPNEGYTAGSQSIQFGGVALRLACAEVRSLFLDHAAERFGIPRAELSVRDGAITHRGAPTGQDYWSLAADIDLARPAAGDTPIKPVSDYRIVGESAPRVDLAAKVFGGPAFLHDMKLDGMLHARVVRQPRRGATIASIDEPAIRRAAKGPVEIVRDGDFLAIVGNDETAVEAAAAVAPGHVAWDGVDALNPYQEEARWLLQQPSVDQTLGAPPADPAPAAARHEATYTRMHVAHASVAPSCGLAVYRDGKLQVWTHCQGVYPLRAALARTLKLDPAAISVSHMQGPGCYGHNGADDAAADAAVIAMRRPGKPIRVRWRREEEFGFEPVSPAMVVSVQAALDETQRPADWTTEIWSGKHTNRPGGGGNLLAAEALPDPPPAPLAVEAVGPPGAGTRNGEPLYAFAAKRIVHHLIAETPVRTSSLRGLGATLNVFAIESFMDELAERAGEDPLAYRLGVLSDPRARAVVEHVARMSGWQPGAPAGAGHGRGIGFARYKNMAAYAAVVVEIEVEETVRVLRVWCAADAGLVINPDGAINQLEGGIVQATSWALKEGVRLDPSGISSRDWEGYPVLRFSEVPEVAVELIEPKADRPPLGVGEASGGPTVAAIGNAVAHALGARIRDLPLTRDRVMAALLKA
ncbi:MAG TPA: molybdopterin cofactor-binding domain-containing protein [Stellaceae bacterium]|jgi:nicotinate dehydrogenase subunit B|nr:molybdopterin cofactor-binding domain-containing protein [Stellaceae bacterium]